MDEHDSGVFGRLPRARPALRSPLRDRRRAASPPPPASSGTKREDESGAPRQASGGTNPLEELALGGIGALTELVVLGIKLSGRAYGGVRDVAGRR